MSVSEAPRLAEPAVPKTELDSARTASLTALQQDAGRRKALVRFGMVTLIGFVLTFALSELACRFIIYLGKPASAANPQFQTKLLVAKTITPWDDNIVLCGDSLVKQGLYPELIAAKLQTINNHIRVVNLAVNGGNQKDAIDYLDFLRTKRHTKPRLLVFDFEVSQTGGATPTVQSFPRHEGYLFDGTLNRSTAFLDNLLLWPRDNSMLVRHQGNIKHFILEFLSTLPNPMLFEMKSFSELCNVDDFGMSYCGMSPDHNLTFLKDVESRQKQITIDLTHNPKRPGFQYNPEVYSPIIKYCQEQEIPLMLVWLPHQTSVYDRLWYQAPYTQSWFKDRFEEYSRRLFVFPCYLNKLPEDQSYFSDYRHLSTYGCIKASELLGEAIANPKYRSLIERRSSSPP